MSNKIIKCKKPTKLGVVFRNIMKYDDIPKYNLLKSKINKNWTLIEDDCKLYIKVYGYEKMYNKYKDGNYIKIDQLITYNDKIVEVKVFKDEEFVNDMIESDKIKYDIDYDKWVDDNNYYLDDKWFEVKCNISVLYYICKVWNLTIDNHINEFDWSKKDEIEEKCEGMTDNNLFEYQYLERYFGRVKLNMISEDLLQKINKIWIFKGSFSIKRKDYRRKTIKREIVGNRRKIFNLVEDIFKPESESVKWDLFYDKLNKLILINNDLCQKFNELCMKIRKTYPKVVLSENMGIKRLDFQGNETITVEDVFFDQLESDGIIRFLITGTERKYRFVEYYGYEVESIKKRIHYLRIKYDQIIMESEVENFRKGDEWINKWV